MQTRLTNPYQALTPVDDPAMFFGPFSVVRRIYAALESNQSVSLFGLRHAGKTTILRCMSQPDVQERLGYDLSRHFFVYMDIRNWLFHKSSRDFLEAVSEAIVATSQRHLQIDVPVQEGETRFMSILEQISARGFHTVLQLDAFDHITKNTAFAPEFFSLLRAQASQRLVSYVTASSRPLDQVYHPALKDSPFFNLFGYYKAEPLAPGEARDLVLIPSQREGCPFTEEEAEWVLKLAGGMPFFLQRVCYHLFERKSGSVGAPLHKKQLARLAYDDLSPHFAYLWDELSEKQQKQLKDEAQRKGLAERDLPELSESSLFRKFVRETCQLSFFHLDEDEMLEEVREALKHLDKTSRLGAGKLRHLKLVIELLRYGDTPLTFKTGLAVREVLNGAFEQMRGTGVRADFDLEWRLYNVLFYTYFDKRSHMNQSQIAARVGVSERHYHRVKDEAIRTLRNILLEMEAACENEEE
ncbi:MAG TPA: hypothetical protein VGF67_26935 [Ktedonobacteraceae bacterium]|jgi:hypothetical protein